MKKTIKYLLPLLLVAVFVGTATADADKTITMSTTTSTQASGLLDVLLPAFQNDTGITVKVIAKGTGAAIRDGKDGNVDVIFVHDLARENKFVEEGYGTKRYAVMHNDFILIGPAKDPAGVKGTKEGAEALKKIADAKAVFISRGDDSGTHSKEQKLWKASGVPLEEMTTTIEKKGKKKDVTALRPANATWYLSVGQGMGKTLTIADEKLAYALADRGTYLKYTLGRDVPIELEILCEGDPQLNNPYGVIPVNPEKHPQAKFELAKTFAEWLISPKGQKLIGDYKLLGKQLFFPDAN
ncbi:MAG: tungsten ABC transporter substrate-binding protein [Deltaproteobacteria bacterium]|nr:MAG: tungsten ABC transporter substrate-binding protein [Deltaproteobacteria bacterium]PIE72135.1 MAG: tungsten ABC transporter substrate-binding protein [Deltaproteobacteria bacterium]